MQRIKIKGETYPISFGYGAVRYLGEIWGLPGITETYQHVIAKIVPDGADGELEEGVAAEDMGKKMLSFENVELMADVFRAGIVNGSDDADIPSRDEIIDSFLQDISMLTVVFKTFIESMPRPGVPNKVPPKKTPGPKVTPKAKKKK